jgi:cell division septal protein FtsQ
MPKPRPMLDACGRAVRRGLPAIVASVVVTALGGGLWLGYRFVTTSERFAIDQIEVHGADRLSPELVRAALPIQRGENLITADLDSARLALRNEPWISTADVRRQLPSTLIVEIKEHSPAVVVELEHLYLADAQGRPFKRASDAERSDLPLVTGLTRAEYRRDPEETSHRVLAALDVLRQWHTGDRLPIREVRYDAHGGIALIAREPALTIELGVTGDMSSRMRTFDAVWNELSTDEHARARTIHLDTRLDHVTVSFKS